MYLEQERRDRAHESFSILYAGTRRWPEPLPASYLIRGRITGTERLATAGTLEHFLIERYVLYTWAGDRLYRGQVHHPPYPLRSASALTVDENLIAALGIERPSAPPLAVYSPGVDVEIFTLRDV
jgi:uncharacterized protein YqjF (DUF2071 family)